jgi:hypothetical protein
MKTGEAHNRVDAETSNNGSERSQLPWFSRILGYIPIPTTYSFGQILAQCLISSAFSFVAGYVVHRWLDNGNSGGISGGSGDGVAGDTGAGRVAVVDNATRRTSSKPMSLRRTVTRPADSMEDSGGASFDRKNYPKSGSLS